MATLIQPAQSADISARASLTGAVDTTPKFAPGQLRVIKRNGAITLYDDSKIAIAVTKAFLEVEGNNAAASNHVRDVVTRLTKDITSAFKQRQARYGDTIWIEDIQDQVELGLMRAEKYGIPAEFAHRVARSYVLYREAHRKIRETKQAEQPKAILQVTLADGTTAPLDVTYWKNIISEACQGLEDVLPEAILKDTQRNLFDGVPVSEVNRALIMAARTYIEKEPNHTYVAARLLLNQLRTEALSFLDLQTQTTQQEMAGLYGDYFAQYVKKAVKLELVDPTMLEYDLAKLGQAIKPERDAQFAYLGLQTLYDRYFIHHRGTRFELPQAFFMRVAMGLAINEKDREARTLEFYNQLSSFDYMSSTPTLFNAATLRPQLSSCYLSTIQDDLEDIFNSIRDNALLSKYAGGLGIDWSYIRAMNAHIKGTNGKSQGIVPFMKVLNDMLVAVNQGGKRKGAGCSYLETWHLDIEEFLELRKNTGDDRRRTHDMNTANWVPDLFMKRICEDGDWTLFSPNETPELHDLYGDEFEKVYTDYEAKAAAGTIENFKTLNAKTLWRKMLTLLFETGHPWITFKDPCNIRSPQQHRGVVHSSNLCTEITLNTSKDEIAVCNLGSINLPAHMTSTGLDKAKLERTIKTAVRMLDNVIDYNYYSVPQARTSNLRHRPVGLGIMGFQDALHILKIPYASDEAVEFADRTMELVSYYAITASSELAEERGTYETYEGSLWSQGVLPIDSIELLAKARGKYLELDRTQTLDWDKLRKQVKKVGMRNSNVMAIAPTATISNICGVSPSIEPTYQNLYVKSNLSGEFTVVNPYLAKELKDLNLWDEVMVHDLKYFDGSVQTLDRVPEDVRERYATAFEVEPRWLVEAGARRQKWIDQAQSLNLYVAEPSGKKMDTLYRMAWLRGLKTTYYLRTMGATSAEKSTISDGALNKVQVGSTTTQACTVDDPDCEACQ